MGKLPDFSYEQVQQCASVLVVAMLGTNATKFSLDLDGFHGPDGEQLGDFVVTVQAKGKHGEEHHVCRVGCPQYSSGHSINPEGGCNLGCC